MAKKSKVKHIERPSRIKKLSDLPPELRGPPQDKYGGHRTQTFRTYGGDFGPANKGRRFSSKEIVAWVKEHERNI